MFGNDIYAVTFPAASTKTLGYDVSYSRFISNPKNMKCMSVDAVLEGGVGELYTCDLLWGI